MPIKLLNDLFLIYILRRTFSYSFKMLVRLVLYGSKGKIFASFIKKNICGMYQQNAITQFSKENPSVWTKII